MIEIEVSDAFFKNRTVPGSQTINNFSEIEIQYIIGSMATVAPSKPLQVSILMSKDLVASADDIAIGEVVYDLDIWSGFYGRTATIFTISQKIGFDKIAPTGTYNLIVFADPKNNFAESDETDNTTLAGTVNYKGYTAHAQELIEKYGQLGLMAKLAQAAYKLHGSEAKGDKLNDAKVGADKAYAELKKDLHVMTGDDLPGVDYIPNAQSKWKGFGLQDGVYVSDNASAFVARSGDALFLSFRGTNDNTGDKSSPDMGHWIAMQSHAGLMKPLITALKVYLAAHGEIEKIYVTGHSLGAAMVEWFMLRQLDENKEFSGVSVEAQVFASPGYTTPNLTQSAINNLRVDGDVIGVGSFFGDNDGDQNKIYHNLSKLTEFDAINLHSMNGYLGFVNFMNSEGIGAKELSDKALHGIDYDRIYVNAVWNADKTAITVAQQNDKITGSDQAEIILGGDGVDVLKGAQGRDHIQGGALGDDLYGGEQGDFLFGGTGADNLFGGLGRDELTGGGGADSFVFRRADLAYIKSVPQPQGLNDTIHDFKQGMDDIDLSDFDPSLRLGDQKLTFIGTRAFTGTAGEVRYVKLDGATRVEVDATKGNGASAGFSFTLDGVYTLTAGDFVL